MTLSRESPSHSYATLKEPATAHKRSISWWQA